MPGPRRSDLLGRMRARSQDPESAHGQRAHGDDRGSSPKREASLGVSISVEVADNAAPPRFWRDVLRRRMLALGDLAVAIFAAVLLSDSLTDLPWALIGVPGWIVAAKLLGLYDRDHAALRHQTLDEVGSIASAVAFGILLISLALSISADHMVTATAALVAWLIVLPAALMTRAWVRWIFRRLTPAERTAVLGEGELAASIQRKLTLFRDMHIKVVATRPLDAGNSEQVAKLVDHIIVASANPRPGEIAHLVSVCRQRGVKLSVVSPLRGRARPSSGLSQVADLPVFGYETWDVSRSTLLIKRLFDLAFGALGLLVLALLFPVIAAAIVLESGRPIFFRQDRAGLEGEPFRMIKFRTMVADAEDRLSEYVRIEELDDPVFKLTTDPRITRVGRVLRRLSLDELPQMVNVVRGDMSIVGPRPEQMELVERYKPEHLFRLAVKPGITGPMQIFGRGDLTFPERLAVELEYVEHVSLARDLRILAETVPVALRGTGAY